TGILSGIPEADTSSRIQPFQRLIKSFYNAGYDYATISAWRTNTLAFPKNIDEGKDSRSLNSGSLITDRDSFEAYPWPDADKGDYELYQDLGKELPDGMKLVASSNGGLLENVIDICGFETISLMTMLDEGLTKDIFDEVGRRLVRFYEIVSSVDTVGACIMNDDWGFKTQTMFDPVVLRKYVFPWHKKMVEAVHKNNKYAILHSCGNVNDVFDDIIDDMKYDGKHSFEDLIYNVEESYETWGDRIAIIGGIDIDFLARQSEENIVKRCHALLDKNSERGGYALGSGNSIPDYIPDENFLALIKAAQTWKKKI
ncbi:MAG: hypothetical protein KAI81_03850, partial [Candidatus Marinimicrobia bacterium]|nr:hypothetical protein [Candidatus Neomarinimicrobiota bacterium]